MATYHAIAVVTQALTKLLEDNCPQTLFPGSGRFVAARSAELRSGPPSGRGVTIFLYEVTRTEGQPNRRPRRDPASGILHKPSLPLSLSYLVTAWWTDAVREQALLGWTLRELADIEVLPSILLEEARLAASLDEEVFGPDESVQIVWSPIPLADQLAIWDAGDKDARPSFTITARTVMVHSDRTVDEPPEVRERVLEIGARGDG